MTSPNTLPYLGRKICLISNAGNRYEGILFNINTQESTVGLSGVRAFGTEGRKPGAEVPGSDDVYDYIVFRGKDIQDLTVSEAAPPDDPAIVAINPMPSSAAEPPASRMAGSFMGSPMGHQNLLTHHNSGGGHRHDHRMGYNDRRGGHYMMDGRGGDSAGVIFPMMNPRNDMPRHGGYHNNYYEHRRGGYHYRENRSGRVVGELEPQLNHTLKQQVGEAFDFVEANKKFDKKEPTATTDATEGKENEKSSSAATTTSPSVPVVYDKKSSFFDRISCEALDRQNGLDARVDRSKQRQLDVETFGQSAAPMRRGNNYRRGGMMGYNRQYGNYASVF